MKKQIDYLAIIFNKVDVQTSKLVNNDIRHGKNGAYGHSGSVHEDKPSADIPCHFTNRQNLKGGALGAGLMILVMMR